MSVISDFGTRQNFYGPIANNQLFGGGAPTTLNDVSGGIPGPSQSAAMFWAVLVALLVAFRLAWEFSPMAKE